MSDQRDPRSDPGRPPGRPDGGQGGPPRRPPGPPPAGPPDARGRPGPPPPYPPRRPGPPPPPPAERVAPQRFRPDAGRAADVPLLTHADAPAGAVAVAEQPAPPVEPGGRRTSPGRVRRLLLWLLGIAVLGPVLAFVVGWVLFDVPSSEAAAVTQVATFTFADGAPLATVRPDNVNRVVVTLDRVPEHVRQAVLAAEDRSFYSNPGFDITGIGRAAWNQLTGGSGGGSTITQQYVKVITGRDDFSLWRKYREIVVAVKISNEQTKDQILENYLNAIYLGRGAYGVQAASQAYFGKDVEQLTVSEGAMLAGIIQSPSRWDPAKNPDRSQERWNFVLDGMVAQNWLSPADRAAQRFPQWLPEPPPTGGIPGDSLGHIYNQAKAELEERGITEQQITTEGLTVTTTVQPDLQRDAIAAAQEVLEGQPDNLRTALVSVDPRSGAILAYYGGENGVGVDYAQALRQPGSSFKPFVFSAALQSGQGIGLGTTYDGSSPQEFPGGVTVQNNEGFNCERCTVKTAMTRSVNTVFYRMGLDVGPRSVADAAHQAGIPEDLLPEARAGISIGDEEVHPVDMASAFATFANDGERFEPYLVSKVTASDGRVLFDRGTPIGTQAVPEDVARNVTEAMIDVPQASGNELSGGRPVAGKTGTVQHPTIDSANKDAWMVGYTPSVSTAVWVGTDTSEPIENAAGRPVFGSMLPGSIWQRFMNDAMRGEPVERFSRFDPLGEPPAPDPTPTSTPAERSGSDSSSDDEQGSDRGRDPEERPGDGDGDATDTPDGSDDEQSFDDFEDRFETVPRRDGAPDNTPSREPGDAGSGPPR